ncbi:MAG: dephospho-CoA kinase [Acholeplasmataceae bacterium]|nr:MAG: dephospho-CoA kinase [Acholeplasmataceae bacterium]
MSVRSVNNRPLILGLTGGIATGKSTASAYFKAQGLVVVDCDEIVKKLWQEDKTMVKEIKDVFGFAVDAPEARRRFSEIIFEDASKRKALNTIIHPLVFNEIEKQLLQHRHEPVIIIDMPLLYEVKYQSKCDQVMLIYINKKTQIERLMKRDGLSRSQALKRLASQIPIGEKKAMADIVFDNSGTQEQLIEHISTFIKELQDEKQ